MGLNAPAFGKTQAGLAGWVDVRENSVRDPTMRKGWASVLPAAFKYGVWVSQAAETFGRHDL
jgi:hypothetical protein